MSEWPDRLNRFVEALRTGRRPESGLARTPEEIDDLRMAAKIAGSRPDFENPDPEFLEQLRQQIGAVNRRPSRRVSRSRLFRVAGTWAAGVMMGLGIERVWQRLQAPPPLPPPTGLPSTGGKWFAVAQVDDLTPGAAKPVDAGAVPAFVVRESGSVRAVSRVCTHMGCLLRFDAQEHEFQCPCHGAVFDLAGHPDPGYDSFVLPPLPSIDVRVVRGTVYVLGA